MWELLMKWYWEPQPGHGAVGEDDYAPGFEAIPAALLQRHGARVLSPADAAAVSGAKPPRSTVYRAKTLLIPPGLLTIPGQGPINEVLGRVGMRLAEPLKPRPIGH